MKIEHLSIKTCGAGRTLVSVELSRRTLVQCVVEAILEKVYPDAAHMLTERGGWVDIEKTKRGAVLTVVCEAPKQEPT
jgi:hypothetical protein